MPTILAVSGSPSTTSRTAAAVDHALAVLTAQGHTTTHLAVRDLPPADLLAGVRDTPALWAAADTLARADGVVIATPVYKASYTGLLKAFLDLLPENALAGKVVLPVVTGGTVGHLLTIDYALRPVLTALGADHVVQGRFLLDADIVRGEDGSAVLAPATHKRLTESLAVFTDALARRGGGDDSAGSDRDAAAEPLVTAVAGAGSAR
jgi:FMN reductase